MNVISKIATYVLKYSQQMQYHTIPYETYTQADIHMQIHSHTHTLKPAPSHTHVHTHVRRRTHNTLVICNILI